jgi:cell wall-associated NlpC family hydrolase
LLDGRKHTHARIAAALTSTALTTAALGLATAAPATAAPQDLDAVQARVDRLSDQAESAEKRHGAARANLTRTRTQLGRVVSEIRRHQRALDTLRSQVATAVSGDQTGHAGASTPPETLSKSSDVLLSNVTLVTEDTGARADAMALSNARLDQLNQRRNVVRTQVTALAAREKTLRQQEQAVDARAANATALLDRLEKKAAAERLKRLGGPVLAYAKSKIGNSYVYGAAGPSSFDCSGLTMMAWSQAGVSLPHSSSAQYHSGPHVSESELQPGDLVFYYSPISHVGIYIGDGQIVNALNPGSGVKISGLHDMPYVGAVRPG